MTARRRTTSARPLPLSDLPAGSSRSRRIDVVDVAAAVEADKLTEADVFRRTYIGHGTQSSVFVFQGHPGPFRTHVHATHDEIGYVLEGTGEVRVGGVTRPVKEGDVWVIPANTPHGGSFEDAPQVLFISSPDRRSRTTRTGCGSTDRPGRLRAARGDDRRGVPRRSPCVACAAARRPAARCARSATGTSTSCSSCASDPSVRASSSSSRCRGCASIGESWPLTVERARHEARCVRDVHGLRGRGASRPITASIRAWYVNAIEDLARPAGLARRPQRRRDPRRAPRARWGGSSRASPSTRRTSGWTRRSASAKAAATINPELCRITEDLVLDEPFREHEHNRHHPPASTASSASCAPTRSCCARSRASSTCS